MKKHTFYSMALLLGSVTIGYLYSRSFGDELDSVIRVVRAEDVQDVPMHTATYYFKDGMLFRDSQVVKLSGQNPVRMMRPHTRDFCSRVLACSCDARQLKKKLTLNEYKELLTTSLDTQESDIEIGMHAYQGDLRLFSNSVQVFNTNQNHELFIAPYYLKNGVARMCGSVTKIRPKGRSRMPNRAWVNKPTDRSEYETIFVYSDNPKNFRRMLNKYQLGNHYVGLGQETEFYINAE